MYLVFTIYVFQLAYLASETTWTFSQLQQKMNSEACLWVTAV